MSSFCRLLACLSFFVFFATAVTAEEVKITFDTNSCFVIGANNQRLETSFPYRFDKLTLGGRCGTAVAKYTAGQTGNNLLTKGMTCIVKGRLSNLAGKGLTKKNLLITNENGTPRSSGKSSSSGKFNLSFKVRANGPKSYSLYGHKTSSGHRVGCTVYAFDHSV